MCFICFVFCEMPLKCERFLHTRFIFHHHFRFHRVALGVFAVCSRSLTSLKCYNFIECVRNHVYSILYIIICRMFCHSIQMKKDGAGILLYRNMSGLRIYMWKINLPCEFFFKLLCNAQEGTLQSWMRSETHNFADVLGVLMI